MKKVSALQAALAANTGKPAPTPAPAPAPVPVPEAVVAAPQANGNGNANGQGRGYRDGKVNISAYLPVDYRRSLRMLHAITDRTVETLMAEALNDLFAKYDVPQIREN